MKKFLLVFIFFAIGIAIFIISTSITLIALYVFVNGDRNILPFYMPIGGIVGLSCTYIYLRVLKKYGLYAKSK